MKAIEKKTHPKIVECLKEMYLQGHEFYVNFYSFVDFYEAYLPDLNTMGVTMVRMRMALLYSRAFVEALDMQQMKYLLVHELYHLILAHRQRSKGYNHQAANIAQDMIINHLIDTNYGAGTKFNFQRPKLTKDFVDASTKELTENAGRLGIKIEASPDYKGIGEDMGVFLDPEYKKLVDDGKEMLVFESLYKWLHDNNKIQYVKANASGLSMDSHGELSEAEEEIRSTIVKEATEKAKQMSSYGSNHGNIDSIMELLLKAPPKNNLTLIKKMVGKLRGSIKIPSFRRPNRKLDGIKGASKIGRGLVVVWDWSGSMYGRHESVASEIYRDGYELHVIGGDTQVGNVFVVDSKAKLKRIPFNGGGGTDLNPQVAYAADPKNKLHKMPMVILTDGECPPLDLSGWKNEVLILTTNEIVSHNGKAIQVKIEGGR